MPIYDEAFSGLHNVVSERQSSSKRRLSISNSFDSAPATKRHRVSLDTFSDVRLEAAETSKPAILPSYQSDSIEYEMMKQLEYALELGMPCQADLGVRPPDGEMEVNLFDYSGWADITSSESIPKIDPLFGGELLYFYTFRSSLAYRTIVCQDLFANVIDGDNLQSHAINSPFSMHESCESLDDLLRQLDGGVAHLPGADVAPYPNYEQGINSGMIMAENDNPSPANRSHLPEAFDTILAFDGSGLLQNQLVSEYPTTSDPISASIPDVPTIPTEIRYSVFDDWTSTGTSIPDPDKEAKLERLMKLREQKCRLAEEERRLEQGKHASFLMGPIFLTYTL